MVGALLAQQNSGLGLDVEQVLEATAGHPMFIDALVRHALGEGRFAARLSLEEALLQRISGLAEPARHLLQIVAVAGAALPHRIVAKISGLQPGLYVDQAQMLRGFNLVRFTGLRQEDAIEPYHARIREALYARLPAESRRELHLSLGQEMEAAHLPPELLAPHFIAGGASEKGAWLARDAAVRACQSMAFDQADRLYRLAIQHGRWIAAEKSALQKDWAEALANAGRSRDAAEAFLEAAFGDELDASERLDLKRRAAEKFLMGGYLAEGLAVSRQVLSAVGLSYPAHPVSALVRIGWYRLLLGARGLSWHRPSAPTPASALGRSDVCWSIAAGLSMVDTVRGSMFATLAPLLSLRNGEPYRIARDLAALAYSESAFGKKARVERLLSLTEQAAAEDGSELARFHLAFCQCASAFMLRQAFEACLGYCEEAKRLWRKAGRGLGWEMDVAEQFACWSLMYLGRHQELSARVQAKVQEARSTSNRFAEVVFLVCFPMVHLVGDDWPRARAEVLSAIGSWLPGERSFGTPHYWAVKALSMIMLYSGDLATDDERVRGEWRRFHRSILGQIPLLLTESGQWEGMLALARAAQAQKEKDLAREQAHRREALKILARLRRMPFPSAVPTARLIELGLTRLSGDAGSSVGLLRQLVVDFQQLEMRPCQAAALRQLAQMLPGEEGERLGAESDRMFAQMAVQNPARYAQVVLPCAPRLSPGDSGGVSSPTQASKNP